jgi:hypothetical protein
MSDAHGSSKLRVVAQEILNYARDAGAEANYALVHRRLLGELREALRAPVETPAHRKWPGEPPHCPSCSCGAPAAALRRYIVEQLGFLSDDDNCPAERFIRLAVAKLRAPETKCDEYGCTGCRSSPCICAQLAPCEHDFDAAGTCKKCRWPFDGNTVKASEPQCICATTAEPLRLVDPQCPKHSTRRGEP